MLSIDQAMNDVLIEPGNPDHVLGVKQMDDTHREFIELVNGLPALQGQDFVAAFDELFRHTRDHFDAEKRLMEESAFPAIREHDDEHRRVLGELNQLRHRMITRRSTRIARTYVELGLPLWFKLHAATMDSALAAHLKDLYNQQRSLNRISPALKSIGTIHTPYHNLRDMPIQPRGACDSLATVEVDAAYQDGLQDLEGFSHIFLIYRLHLSEGYELTVTPFLDDRPHGLFSTRAPKRPNPIGLSLVELTLVEDNILHVRGADVIDGTPLLDIKPYIEAFDCVHGSRSGWMTSSIERIRRTRSDNRFNTENPD